MMTSEQTDARIGRRMKVSTNMRYWGLTGAPSPIFWMPDDDQPVARLEPAGHDVVVADDFADLHRMLTRDQPAVRPGSATKQKYWPLMRVTAVTGIVSARHRAPDDARSDELLDAHGRRRLREERSSRAPSASSGRRAATTNVIGLVRDDLAVDVEDLHRQAELQLRRAIDRHLDVGLEPAPCRRWS